MPSLELSTASCMASWRAGTHVGVTVAAVAAVAARACCSFLADVADIAGGRW